MSEYIANRELAATTVTPVSTRPLSKQALARRKRMEKRKLKAAGIRPVWTFVKLIKAIAFIAATIVAVQHYIGG